MQYDETRMAAIRKIIREGREAKDRGEFDTIRGPEDEAKLFKRLTGRPARWLQPRSVSGS